MFHIIIMKATKKMNEIKDKFWKRLLLIEIEKRGIPISFVFVFERNEKGLENKNCLKMIHKFGWLKDTDTYTHRRHTGKVLRLLKNFNE